MADLVPPNLRQKLLKLGSGLGFVIGDRVLEETPQILDGVEIRGVGRPPVEVVLVAPVHRRRGAVPMGEVLLQPLGHTLALVTTRPILHVDPLFWLHASAFLEEVLVSWVLVYSDLPGH